MQGALVVKNYEETSMSKLLLQGLFTAALGSILVGCTIYDTPGPAPSPVYTPAIPVYSNPNIQPVNPPAPVWKGPSAPLFSNPGMMPTNPSANKVQPYHGKGFNPPVKPVNKPLKPTSDKDKKKVY